MNTGPQRIEIVGGGLAGLSLGIALRRAGVPVAVFEAGDYPRHRVCGEFIAGLQPHTIDALGLDSILAGARPHRQVAWFRNGREFRRQPLSETAWALSRYELDARLARTFVEYGGELRTHQRIDPAPQPGRINATGRSRVRSSWVGLKLHVRGLALAGGLEMHLGREAYVGLCKLPDGLVNVCGLFRHAAGISGGDSALVSNLRANGLETLAERIAAAQPEQGSATAVAGFGFAPAPLRRDPRVGDALGMLPPFLGNGMAAAFEAAEEALPVLVNWSRGGLGWTEACDHIETRMRHRFHHRQRWGNALHGFLIAPRRQRWFAALAGAHWLPLNPLYRTLHSS